jgi:hypothetical protein
MQDTSDGISRLVASFSIRAVNISALKSALLLRPGLKVQGIY